MTADGGRQAELRTEEVDRAGLAVILRQDSGLGALIGRQAVVDLRHGGGHLAPSELVAEMLRQRTFLAGLIARIVDADDAFIANQRFRRENRQRQRRRNGSAGDDERWNGEFEVGSEMFSPKRPARGEQQRINRREVIVLRTERNHHREQYDVGEAERTQSRLAKKKP